MKLSAQYRGSEIEVHFAADAERNDYGVPGSPVWYEPVNIEITALEVLGVDVEINALPDALQNEIYALADEVDFE